MPRLPRVRVPRIKSNTTVIAIRYDNCCMVGSDSRVTEGYYGRVLSNSWEKIIVPYGGISMLYSGDGSASFDLENFLPLEFSLEPPESIEDVVNAATKYINSFMESVKTSVTVFVVGGVGAETPKIFRIKKKLKSWVHSAVLLKDKDKFVVGGSGGGYARSFLEESAISHQDNISVEEGCQLILGALKAAAGKDHGSGGVLQICHMSKGIMQPFFWNQKNAKYCKSEYHVLKFRKPPKHLRQKLPKH